MRHDCYSPEHLSPPVFIETSATSKLSVHSSKTSGKPSGCFERNASVSVHTRSRSLVSYVDMALTSSSCSYEPIYNLAIRSLSHSLARSFALVFSRWTPAREWRNHQVESMLNLLLVERFAV